MKILVFGAGLVGTAYAWQLQESGCDVTLLVRKQRMVRFAHSGISISYTDMRGGGKDYGHTVFRPKVTDRLDDREKYDIIIVCVRSNQLKDALPYISKHSGNADIFILGNIWDEYKLAGKHFPKGRCFYGFPDIVAGGMTESGINCYLFRKVFTVIGEPGGKISSRLVRVAGILEDAGLSPMTEKNIISWLQYRYLVSAILPPLISKAGSARLFLSARTLVKQYIIALKEGQRVCRKRGFEKRNIFPFTRFYLPYFILRKLIKRKMGEEVQAALESQMKHGVAEKKKQYYDVLNCGKRHRVPMPYWASFEKYMDFS